MNNKQYIYLNNGEKIHYEISNCGNEKKNSIVVLCHGFSSSMFSKTNCFLKTYLGKFHIPTIAFDFFGHGKSSGKFEDLTISKCVYDIQSVVSFLKNEKGYKKIGIIGSSFGGLTSLIAASLIKDIICVLGLIAPITNPKNATKIIARHLGTNLDEWINNEIPCDENKRLKHSFCQDAHSIHYDLDNIKVPLLIAHGTNDYVVPVTESERIFWTKDNCFLLSVRNIEHGFQDTPEYHSLLILVASFVIEKL
jgi:pimeloyl-ACP methyl ester carboxylesterase